MTPKWIAEELQLWNTLNDPGDPDLYRWERRVKRMPAGKNKTKLQQQITKDRARQFAAGWTAFNSLVNH